MRKNKNNLDYFSHDVDMRRDTRVKFLIAVHGLVGYAVFNILLENIYHDTGYYLPMSERDLILFSNDVKIDINVCKDIINVCINEGLFDKTIYEKYQILTSCRTQKMYCEAHWRRHEILFIKEYLLIEPEKFLNPKKMAEIIYSNISLINVNINEENVNINDGIVDNKKQTLNLKPKTIKPKEETIFDVDILKNEEFKKTWEEWKRYRVEIKHPLSPTTIKKQLTSLDKHPPGIATAMLNQSMEKGWEGIFELKQNTNGSSPIKKEKEPDFFTVTKEQKEAMELRYRRMESGN